MGDKSVEWERGGFGFIMLVAKVGPVTLAVHNDDGPCTWRVYGLKDLAAGKSPSLPEAKRAAIEAARRVLRESLGMLDALEGSS